MLLSVHHCALHCASFEHIQQFFRYAIFRNIIYFCTAADNIRQSTFLHWYDEYGSLYKNAKLMTQSSMLLERIRFASLRMYVSYWTSGRQIECKDKMYKVASINIVNLIIDWLWCLIFMCRKLWWSHSKHALLLFKTILCFIPYM